MPNAFEGKVFLSPNEREIITVAGAALNKSIQNGTCIEELVSKQIDQAQTLLLEKLNLLQFSPLVLFTAIFLQKKIDFGNFDVNRTSPFTTLCVDQATEDAVEETFAELTKEELQEFLRKKYLLPYEKDYTEVELKNELTKYFAYGNTKELEDNVYLESQGFSYYQEDTITICAKPECMEIDNINPLNSHDIEQRRPGSEVTYSDRVHMTIAHECIEAIYGLNMQFVKDIGGNISSSDNGEFIASQKGIELYLHHAVRHNKKHNVPRFYTCSENRESLRNELIDAVKGAGRNSADTDWDAPLASSINSILERIDIENDVSRLRSCPSYYGGLFCPNAEVPEGEEEKKIQCPYGKTTPCGYY